jgi:hypothetical protein
MLIVSNKSRVPLALEIRLRSDKLASYFNALKDAIQGVAAIMSQGDKWEVQSVFVTASEVIRALHQSQTRYRISIPSSHTLGLLEIRLLNVLTFISQRVMELFLELLKSRDIDLGNLYGPAVPAIRRQFDERKCPICGVVCWERARVVHGLKDACLVQLQCALCGIVSETPAYLTVNEICIRANPEVMLVTLSLHNEAAFPVVLSFKWHSEAHSTPGNLTYQELGERFETVILSPGEKLDFSFESEAPFLRVLHFYFSANGYAGFVQIKDVEPARNHKNAL